MIGRVMPVLAWAWVAVVIAAYLAQFRDILPALTARFLP